MKEVQKVNFIILRRRVLKEGIEARSVMEELELQAVEELYPHYKVTQQLINGILIRNQMARYKPLKRWKL